MKEPAIYTITQKGATLGSKIRDKMGGTLYVFDRYKDKFDAIPFKSIRALIKDTFQQFSSHIFIMAGGIVVRTISQFINAKTLDPAVVFMDQEGRYVISLLSGHIGGANELARKVAKITGGTPVITTATDTEGLLSIDMICKKKGISIQNIEATKRINSAMLDGHEIQVYDPDSWLHMNLYYPYIRDIRNEEDWIKRMPGIWVTWKDEYGGEDKLVLHPACLIVGIGCNKGTSSQEIIGFIKDVFNKNNLSLMSIKSVVSMEEKRNETGLIEACDALNLSLEFVSLKDISDIDVPNPSMMVEKHMGVKSVCEAVAIKISGQTSLLVPKQKGKNVTLAIALLS